MPDYVEKRSSTMQIKLIRLIIRSTKLARSDKWLRMVDYFVTHGDKVRKTIFNVIYQLIT